MDSDILDSTHLHFSRRSSDLPTVLLVALGDYEGDLKIRKFWNGFFGLNLGDSLYIWDPNQNSVCYTINVSQFNDISMDHVEIGQKDINLPLSCLIISKNNSIRVLDNICISHSYQDIKIPASSLVFKDEPKFIYSLHKKSFIIITQSGNFIHYNLVTNKMNHFTSHNVHSNQQLSTQLNHSTDQSGLFSSLTRRVSSMFNKSIFETPLNQYGLRSPNADALRSAQIQRLSHSKLGVILLTEKFIDVWILDIENLVMNQLYTFVNSSIGETLENCEEELVITQLFLESTQNQNRPKLFGLLSVPDQDDSYESRYIAKFGVYFDKPHHPISVTLLTKLTPEAFLIDSHFSMTQNFSDHVYPIKTACIYNSSTVLFVELTRGIVIGNIRYKNDDGKLIDVLSGNFNAKNPELFTVLTKGLGIYDLRLKPGICFDTIGSIETYKRLCIRFGIEMTEEDLIMANGKKLLFGLIRALQLYLMNFQVDGEAHLRSIFSKQSSNIHKMTPHFQEAVIKIVLLILNESVKQPYTSKVQPTFPIVNSYILNDSFEEKLYALGKLEEIVHFVEKKIFKNEDDFLQFDLSHVAMMTFNATPENCKFIGEDNRWIQGFSGPKLPELPREVIIDDKYPNLLAMSSLMNEEEKVAIQNDAFNGPGESIVLGICQIIDIASDYVIAMQVIADRYLSEQCSEDLRSFLNRYYMAIDSSSESIFTDSTGPDQLFAITSLSVRILQEMSSWAKSDSKIVVVISRIFNSIGKNVTQLRMNNKFREESSLVETCPLSILNHKISILVDCHPYGVANEFLDIIESLLVDISWKEGERESLFLDLLSSILQSMYAKNTYFFKSNEEKKIQASSINRFNQMKQLEKLTGKFLNRDNGNLNQELTITIYSSVNWINRISQWYNLYRFKLLSLIYEILRLPEICISVSIKYLDFEQTLQMVERLTTEENEKSSDEKTSISISKVSYNTKPSEERINRFLLSSLDQIYDLDSRVDFIDFSLNWLCLTGDYMKLYYLMNWIERRNIQESCDMTKFMDSVMRNSPERGGKKRDITQMSKVDSNEFFNRSNEILERFLLSKRMQKDKIRDLKWIHMLTHKRFIEAGNVLYDYSISNSKENKEQIGRQKTLLSLGKLCQIMSDCSTSSLPPNDRIINLKNGAENGAVFDSIDEKKRHRQTNDRLKSIDYHLKKSMLQSEISGPHSIELPLKELIALITQNCYNDFCESENPSQVLEKILFSLSELAYVCVSGDTDEEKKEAFLSDVLTTAIKIDSKRDELNYNNTATLINSLVFKLLNSVKALSPTYYNKAKFDSIANRCHSKISDQTTSKKLMVTLEVLAR